jgi:hypothetical protein
VGSEVVRELTPLRTATSCERSALARRKKQTSLKVVNRPEPDHQRQTPDHFLTPSDCLNSAAERVDVVVEPLATRRQPTPRPECRVIHLQAGRGLSHRTGAERELDPSWPGRIRKKEIQLLHKSNLGHSRGVAQMLTGGLDLDNQRGSAEVRTGAAPRSRPSQLSRKATRSCVAFARRDSERIGLSASVDQRFAEPVALSFTQPADRSLPRRAFRLGFDLVALRARRTREPRGSADSGQVATIAPRRRRRGPCRAPARSRQRRAPRCATGARTNEPRDRTASGRVSFTPTRATQLVSVVKRPTPPAMLLIVALGQPTRRDGR